MRYLYAGYCGRILFLKNIIQKVAQKNKVCYNANRNKIGENKCKPKVL